MACSSLEGGFMTVVEGLGDSRAPCAQVLSVPGFFTVLGRFPAGERFILRGREASFLRENPCLFDTWINTDINPMTLTRDVVTTLGTVHWDAGRVHLPGCTGGIYTRVHLPAYTREEGYTSVQRPLASHGRERITSAQRPLASFGKREDPLRRGL